jgi:penicillin-binding protein 1A
MRKRPARRPTRPFSQTMPLPPSFTAAIAQLQSLLRQGWQALRQFLATRTRRQWWQAAACVPVFLVLLLGVLVLLTPSLSDIRKAKEDNPAQILSADGKELALFTRSNRRWVPLAQISPNVVKALIATEDHRFYEHHGWTGAAPPPRWSTPCRGPPGRLHHHPAAGAQPLPGKSRPRRHAQPQAQGSVTAFKIEALYTKDEILETYLNTVPFLYNAFGIEMAARTYFDKGADKLTVLEAPPGGHAQGHQLLQPGATPSAPCSGATPC